MKEYIKKFENPAAADQYAIKDIPFITSVDGDPIQNLHCNLSGKKLVNVSGIVEVQSAGPEPPEMIDLGLPSGILWCAHNLGANPGSTPESYYGGYYAWGETETKSDYSWNTYKWGNPNDGGLTKYNSIDGKLTLDLEDDVVNVTYGDNYKMPTKTELQELRDNTDNIWVNDYNGISGLNGRKFMKKSDHNVFIFIPASGYMLGENNIPPYPHNLTESYIWASELDGPNGDTAGILQFTSSTIYVHNKQRQHGLHIRPVRSANS